MIVLELIPMRARGSRQQHGIHRRRSQEQSVSCNFRFWDSGIQGRFYDPCVRSEH